MHVDTINYVILTRFIYAYAYISADIQVLSWI